MEKLGKPANLSLGELVMGREPKEIFSVSIMKQGAENYSGRRNRRFQTKFRAEP